MAQSRSIPNARLVLQHGRFVAVLQVLTQQGDGIAVANLPGGQRSDADQVQIGVVV